jgi:hypothetical protein
LSPESFLRNAVPLLLNSTGRVFNNYSLGVPALVAMALAVPGGFRRGASRVTCLAAGTLLLVLMLWTFEARFVNRYLLLAPAAAFAVACAWLSSRSSAPLWRTAVPVGAALGLMVAYVQVDSVFQALGRPSVSASIAAGGARADDELARRLRRVRRAERLLEPGESLLIDDARIYLLDKPWVNANARHSSVLRYDRLNPEGLARRLESMRVGAALVFRPIPDHRPQLEAALERYGVPVGRPRRPMVYDLSWGPAGGEER